jgi:hypothetical protein
VLFGYLGLRLFPDFKLHIDPSLPPQIPQIRYRTFHWNGWPISAFSNQTHTVLTRDSTLTPGEGAVPNSTYATTPIPVVVGPPGSSSGALGNYSLAANSSITIPNRLIGQIKTTRGNVAQCLPVTSPDDFVPGQFPLAAIDGATSTKWQPTLANKTASITVSLPVGYRVSGMHFDWAQAPPWNYSVLFHNETLNDPSATTAPHGAGVVEVASAARVHIATAYNATEILDIGPLMSNVTTYTVPATQMVYTARYATLRVWGSLANGTASVKAMSGQGATVAEWSILVDGLSAGTSGKRDLGGNLRTRGMDDDVLFKLGRVARYMDGRKRMEPHLIV